MEINVHDDKKYVSIWLTKAESADTELKSKLESLYAEFKKKKYRVVIFESGNGDLALLTKALLAHNLEVVARREG